MKSLLVCSALFALCCSAVAAADPAPARPVAATGHEFVWGDVTRSRAVHVLADGTLAWEFPAKLCQEAWKLANGNYLVSHVRGAKEVTPDKKVVWEYTSPEKTEVHSCQPLPDGAVLVCEGGTAASGPGSPRIVEVDRDGKIRKEFKLETKCGSPHMQFRSARKTAAGTYLVAQITDHVVREYDAEGRVIRTIATPGGCYAAVRLPNGNTLISLAEGQRDGKGVIEIDPADTIVWSIGRDELPGNPLRFAAGLHRLPNGNTVIANWLGHGFLGKQPMLLEVTPDKKVVWQFEDHARFAGLANGYLVDVPGDAAKGELLH
ncbi:MAG: hypothetical protein WCC69_09035 [Pirellulales bacterium]